MNWKLLLHACFKFVLGFIMIGLLLFLPAGTFEFWNAWLLIELLFIPMIMIGLILWFKKPGLLQKRLNGKEKEKEQKNIIIISIIVFVIGFIVAALDFRFSWSESPKWLITCASILLLFSYGLYVEVMRENTYLSRTVEIQENQKVIDTGLYGIVRHPMYLATTLLFLSFPLVLGSIFSFIIFLAFPILLVKRIKNEEAILEEGLDGYKAYKEKVKYRMIPFIW